MNPEVAIFGLQPITFIAVASVFMILSAIAVSLRIWVRGIMLRAFGWDDGFLLLALVRRLLFTIL